MRTRKIRGYSKVLGSINRWEKKNLELDVTNLRVNQRDYVKVWVHPYSSISLLNSSYPAPRGKARKLILKGLINIYTSWHQQLQELGEAYYLKLWLYPHDISKSQVVCAIGDFLNFYTHTFHLPKTNKAFPADQFGQFAQPLQNFNWVLAHEEIHLKEEDIGEPEDYPSLKEYYAHRKRFAEKITHARLITEDEEGQKTYSVKQDIVWLGGIP